MFLEGLGASLYAILGGHVWKVMSGRPGLEKPLIDTNQGLRKQAIWFLFQKQEPWNYPSVTPTRREVMLVSQAELDGPQCVQWLDSSADVGS